MELVLHIGPHKTGTTSLQQSFLQRYGAHKPQKIWYPTPGKNGPGHAELAWSFYQNADPTSNPLLAKLLNAGLKNGCEKLIISAEDFSHLEDSSIFLLKRHLKGLSIHLVATFTPIQHRLASTWQEMIKHGYDGTFENFLESLKEFKQFAPNLVERWNRVLKPQKTSIVNVSNSTNPEKLFEDVSFCTGIEIQPTRTPLNQSLGQIETTILRFLNHRNITKHNHRTRRLLIRLFQSKIWKLGIPRKKISVPKAYEILVKSLESGCPRGISHSTLNEIIGEDKNLKAA